MKKHARGWPTHRGLPFAVTSDIRLKRLNKRHRYSHRVIEYAIGLLVIGYGPVVVARKIRVRFGYAINPVTVWKWQRKFVPWTVRGKNRPHNEEWRLSISRGMSAFCMQRTLLERGT